jgi:phospholipid N-methyltransferase
MKQFLKSIIPNSIKTAIKNSIDSNQETSLKRTSSTSLSDNQLYPNFCLKASTDLSVFYNFRRNAIYQEILEHVNYETGKEYLSEITKNNPELLKNIDAFKKNDEFGSPETFDFASIGNISSSTLRYVKVAGDLISLFKNLDNLNICEIGVGYGGQCRVLNSAASPAKYTLVDIKAALMLTQRFLDNFILNSVVKYKTMNELEVQNYDLVISNYAFTELPKSIQDVYLKKIILNSKRGYITYNDINPAHFNSYKKDALLKIIPNSRIIEEKPLTHKENCIIVWGDNL